MRTNQVTYAIWNVVCSCRSRVQGDIHEKGQRRSFGPHVWTAEGSFERHSWQVDLVTLRLPLKDPTRGATVAQSSMKKPAATV